MSSILSKTSLAKIENVRKYVLKMAIWLLVGGVILGAITILLGGASSGETIGKFMGTIWIVALMMIISVNNFKRVALEDEKIQIFALMGLVSNLVWALLWTILCWMPELGRTCASSCATCTNFRCGMSMLIKCAVTFSYLSALGLIGSNVLAIYEGDRKNLIKPLKITALICATYVSLYCIAMTFSDFSFTSEFTVRLGMLAGFAGVAWLVAVIVAVILSKNEKNRIRRKEVASQSREIVGKKTSETKIAQAKTDEELRAEIEEQVRCEMIEKEVRAKLEAEKAEKKSEENSEIKE